MSSGRSRWELLTLRERHTKQACQSVEAGPKSVYCLQLVDEPVQPPFRRFERPPNVWLMLPEAERRERLLSGRIASSVLRSLT